MKSMISTKRHRYANKSMRPGDGFSAPSRDADILVRLGRAEYDTADAVTDAVDDISALRGEYQRIVGKKPFYGWDAETLKAKIAGAN